MKLKNNIYFLIEILIYSILLISFLLLNFFNISQNFANLIYISFIILSFGWLFINGLILKTTDIAVHNKMFQKFYKATNKTLLFSAKRKGLWIIVILWIFYLSTIALLKYFNFLTWQIFLAGACIIFMLNSFFTRKVCLLSLLFLHNKNNCCKNCGINSWDYLIFSSALFFAPKLSLFATVLNIVIIIFSLIIFISWEIVYHNHPERFYQETNANLTCKNCSKQCIIKNKK